MSQIAKSIADLPPEAKRALLAQLLQKKAQEGSATPLPRMVPAPDRRHDPFPLSDTQEAYWIGRSAAFELGNVGAHVYLEVETTELDLARLNLAWQRLIDRHDMLRAVVLPDGQQQILEHVPPYQIEMLDLHGHDPRTAASRLEGVRQRMSHQVFLPDRWPLFEIRLSRLADRRTRVHISLDLLIADIRSIQILLDEWFRLYRHPAVSLAPLEISFRDYALAERALQNSEVYAGSQEYWCNRISTLPSAPELPLARNPGRLFHPRFVRRSARLERECWSRLKIRAHELGLTPSAVLLTAFSAILTVWSTQSRFSINVTIFNRLPFHPQVNDIVGDFTLVNLLEVDASGQDSFQAWARRLQERLWNDLDHRHFSGVRVLRELARTQGGTPRAVMPIVFTCDLVHDLASVKETHPLPIPVGMVYGVSQTPQVWLDHQVFEAAGALDFNWDAVEDLFPDGLLDDMFEAYHLLLRRLANEEKACQEMARQLVPVSSDQLERRAAINSTEAPIPVWTLHDSFAAQVPQRPHQVAVVSSCRTLTYEELHRRANQVSRRLRELGARPNTLVAVVLGKGWEQVVAVLGILQAGAAYLPIDPDLPAERLRYLLDHGAVKAVLTRSWFDENLKWPESVQRLCLDDDGLAGVDDRPLEPVSEPEDLAYVIYTSGSTGQPKGVMIDHRGALNTILDINQRFGVGPEDRVLALSSSSFDLSVYEIFGTLAAGGTLVLPAASAARDPARWAECIECEQVTIWNSVPVLMEMLVEYAATRPERRLQSLRLVLLSGDWIPVTLPERIKALVENVQVISLGGATEASIWSILYPIEHVDPEWRSIPYGKPMMNQHFHVLNEALEPVPVWVPAELYIGGIGLAKGYWRDEEKTRVSFIRHPRTGERLYRTGDLGRYLPDGNIELLGRKDLQVKIQGYRVEPGEIEVALKRHPAVRAAVVAVAGEPQGNRRLIAYFVPADKNVPTDGDLQSFLLEQLPRYMVPGSFVMLDSLPLTPNGKVDRRALPEPDQSTSASLRGLHSPKAKPTSLEIQISDLVARVLNVDSVNPQASLLELGLNSVAIMRLASLLEQTFGFRPGMGDFFRLTTISAVAEYYEQHRREGQLSGEGAEVDPERPVDSLAASFRLLLDPREREEFRRTQPGLRRFREDVSHVELSRPEPSAESSRGTHTERCSHRKFALELISLKQFSDFLSCLRQITVDGNSKYRYGSAGGLYPVQTYMHIKPARVEGIGAGIYYYHPKDHRLSLLSAEAHLDGSIHWPTNRFIFDAAAFSIFLIAPLSAIAPIYGEKAMAFALLEAGSMSQLLETSAPDFQIGLCQVGGLAFERIRDLFALKESHVFLHSLLGGRLEGTSQAEGWSFLEQAPDNGVDKVEEWEEGEL